MTRNTAVPSIYLFLFSPDGQKVLLSKRQNTGYLDDCFQIPCGHLEDQELPHEGMIREAKEEVGISIAAEDLEFVNFSYRPRHHSVAIDNRVDIFFKATKYQGEISNPEPHKCSGWEWFDIDNLPSNMVYHIHRALLNVTQGKSYDGGMTLDYLKSIGEYDLDK